MKLREEVRRLFCNHDWCQIGDTAYILTSIGCKLGPMALGRCRKCGLTDFVRIILPDLPRKTHEEYMRDNLWEDSE